MSAPLLLIDDTPSLRLLYESILRNAGHDVRSAETAEEGLQLFRDLAPAVVLLDLMLPDRDGLELMAEMLQLRPETAVIVITAHGSINKAVEAMRGGAFEFLVKPFDDARFLAAVANAARDATPEAGAEPPARIDAVGGSPAMRAVMAKVASVARSMATVFITGESGTGKGLCARMVHEASPRAAGPFIALNCGAIPRDRLESEVFGHLKGAFAGAISDKDGAAMAADGGTLFLDEVCEMDLALQSKLLRFLETSSVQPLGANRPHKVDLRIICASNRDPLEEMRRGTFREDLYYRLYVVPIHMPPLRDRGGDAVAIAEAALARFSVEEGRAFRGLSPEVAALFQRLPWPGNVRQMLNVLRNAVVLHEGELLSAEMLPPELRAELAAGMQADWDAAPGDGLEGGTGARPSALPPDGGRIESFLGLTLAEAEQRLIEATIAREGGSVPRAARVLGVSPSTLYRKREAWLKGG